MPDHLYLKKQHLKSDILQTFIINFIKKRIYKTHLQEF